MIQILNYWKTNRGHLYPHSFHVSTKEKPHINGCGKVDHKSNFAVIPWVSDYYQEVLQQTVTRN